MIVNSLQSVLVQKCFEEVDEHHRMIMSTLSRVRDSGIPWEEAAPTDWAKVSVKLELHFEMVTTLRFSGLTKALADWVCTTDCST